MNKNLFSNQTTIGRVQKSTTAEVSSLTSARLLRHSDFLPCRWLFSTLLNLGSGFFALPMVFVLPCR
jgi:hypothetical protein